MKKLFTLMLAFCAFISVARAQQYYCQPYYGDNKIRIYTTTNPVASSPAYTIDVSADVNAAWGETTSGPNDVLFYKNKMFVSFDLGDRGGVLIYNLTDVLPTRNGTAPMVLRPQTTNGLETAGMAINPANGDLYVATFFDGADDSGVYQYTAASNYATVSQFASYFNDNSVAAVCADLAFDTGGNLWMTTWTADDNATDHFLICYKGLNKNNYYKIVNTATASYSATDVSGASHTGLNLLSAPEGIAFDPSGNLWLGNNNDFALTNGAGQGTLDEFTSAYISTLLASTSTGSGGGNYSPSSTQVNIKYIANGKEGGIYFTGSTMYLNDQGQNQGSDYTTNGTVWNWNVTTAFNATNFAASGIHTTYPGNGGGGILPAGNATLSALTISQGTLSPAFASGTASYTASVANGMTSLTVTPTATDPTAIIKVNGNVVTSGAASSSIALAIGSNTITVAITAGNGVTTGSYTVTVTRAAAAGASLSSLVISAGTLTPAFAAGTTTYTASVANTVTSLTVTPTTGNAGATIKVNGTTVASGAASGAIALAVGSNVINTVVTASDGVTTTTYTVTVTRAAPTGTSYYCLPYYSDNKLRIYNSANPVASSPAYTVDLSADVNTAWGETVTGPNDVVFYNNKMFVSFDLGDRGGVLIYNLTDVLPTRNANAPIVLKPQTTNGLECAGMAINPANGDLYVATFYNGSSDAGVYQYTAASNYATVSQFASYFNDNSVATYCSNLTFDTGGNLWMTTWDDSDAANAHFLICYKGLDKNNYYKITNAATAAYSATDVSGTNHTGLNLLSAPEGIAFDPSGNLWLGNNNDFALTNPAGAGTLVEFPSAYISTLLGSPSTGESAGNPTYSPTTAQVNIKYIASGKEGGVDFNGNTMYLSDQGQNQGTDYTANGTVWKWDVTTAFNATNFAASGIHTTYPGNGGGAFLPTGNATLSALAISQGTLSPVFASGTATYTASVANSITSLTVTPTAADATAIIKVNGTTVTSGTASASIPLTVGSNTITIAITAGNGVTTGSYTVTVTRASAGIASLSNFTISNGTLSPVFASATTTYSTSVGYGLKTFTVTPTASDPAATIKVNGTTVASGTASGAIALVPGPNTVTTVVTASDEITTETYTLTVTEAHSSNNNLAGLIVTSGTLSPAFAAATTSYTEAVTYPTSTITITPTTADPTATITVNGTAVTSGSPSGAIALSVGANTITTVVTAQNTATKTYTIMVTRAAASTNDNLSALTISKGTLSPAFATATTVYTDVVTNGTASVTVTPTVADATATITVNGVAVTSGKASGAITLAVGSNTITTKVTAQDGVTSQSYTITVIRPSTNAKLSNLVISAGTLTPSFNTNTVSYTASVVNTASSITLTPTVTVTGATVTVNGTAAASGSPSGAIALSVGSNTITTIVTAQDGVTTDTYTLTVTRAKPAIATLSGLTLSKGTLSPAFATGTTSYTDMVTNGTASVTLTPTLTDPLATVTVNGVAVKSGAASGTITLAVGSNTVTTIVTAQDGVTTETYTVNVIRPSTNAKLSAFTISSGTLTPAFNTNTVSYTASVPFLTSSITVTPTVTVAGATVKVNGVAVTSGTASGSISLLQGTNTITTIVTAQDGVTTDTYTLTVTRAEGSTNDNLSGLTISKGTLTPVFATATTSYSDMVTNGTSSVTVTPTLADATATATVNGAAVVSGKASGAITLAVGSNTISIAVTAQNGSTTQTYTVTVIRPSTDAKLSALTISSGTLTPAFNTNTISYTASVTNATASVTVTPTVVVNGATVTVNGTAVAPGKASEAIALSVGSNTITTIVTAQDGVTTDTYTITVTRAAAGDNTVYQPVSVETPLNSPELDDDVLIVHQGISPNGDGINDFLVIDGILAYPDNKLSIMNRNGQLVYEAKGYDNITKPFDGHSNKNGQMQLPGTYFYSLDYTVKGAVKHKTGFLVLKY